MNNHFTYMWQRQPYKAWKGESTNSIVPVWTKPNINGPVPPGTTYIKPNGPNFKARPIRHWRKQLEPRNGSGRGRAGVGMPMDVPGGKVAIGKNVVVSYAECNCPNAKRMKDNILRDNPSKNVISVYKQGVVLKQTSDNAIPEVMLGAYCKVDKTSIPSKIITYLNELSLEYINNYVFKNKFNYYLIVTTRLYNMDEGNNPALHIIGDNIDINNMSLVLLGIFFPPKDFVSLGDINTNIDANILNLLTTIRVYSINHNYSIIIHKIDFVDHRTSCLSFTKPTDKDNLLDIRKEYQLDDDDVIKLEKRPSSSPQKFLNRSKFNPQIVDLGNPKVVCTSCNPENNRLRTGSVNFNENYSDNTASYLASRCKTYDKNLLGINDPETIDRNPVTQKLTWPDNSDTGPQNRIAANCNGPVKNSINIISKSNQTPRCNYKIIYKPNNMKFAKQGASTSGSRIQRLRYDTLTNYGSQFNSSQGAQATNDGTFLFDAMAQYFIKTKYQAFIHHRKPGNHSKCFLTPTGSVGGVAPLPPPVFDQDPAPIKQKYSCGLGSLEGTCVVNPQGAYTSEDCQNGACDPTPISEKMGVCDGQGNCAPVDPNNYDLTTIPCKINNVVKCPPDSYDCNDNYCPECWGCPNNGDVDCIACGDEDYSRCINPGGCKPDEADACNSAALQLSAFKAQKADDNDVELLNNDEEESYDKVLEDDTMYG